MDLLKQEKVAALVRLSTVQQFITFITVTSKPFIKILPNLGYQVYYILFSVILSQL